MNMDFIARGLAQQTATAVGLENPGRIDLRQFLDGVGQGNETIDTDALHMAWVEASTPIVGSDGNAKTLFPTIITLPPGELLIASGLNSDEIAVGNQVAFSLQGMGRNATRIRLTDPEAWLIDSDKPLASLLMQDLQVHLGAGTFRQRGKQHAVGPRPGSLSFIRCAFSDYTKAAIVSNSDDDPFYHIWNSKFTGGADSRAIVLPLGGGHVIGGGTWINGYKYGIVLRDGSDCNIGYVRFGGQVAANPRTDIWIVPENTRSGAGLTIHNCYHGNENDNPQDREILIADADTSGNPDHATEPAWEDYDESTSRVTSGDVRQATFRDNQYSADAGRARGIIYSRCERLSILFEDTVDGSYPYVVEFDDNAIPALGLDNHFAQTNRIALRPEITAALSPQPNIRISNLPGFGFAEGYTDAVAGDPAVPRPGGSVIPTSLMSNTLANIATAGGLCTFGALQNDMAGTTDAREITFNHPEARCWQELDLTDADTQRLAWLEFDVKRADSQSVTEAQVRIGTSYSTFFRLIRFRVEPHWQRIAIPFLIPQIPANLFAVFMPASEEHAIGSVDKMLLGRVNAYHAECRV